MKEVSEGFECGIGVENFNDIKVGDVLECYRTEESRAHARAGRRRRISGRATPAAPDRVGEAIREEIARVPRWRREGSRASSASSP